jgi:histidine phosphotransfer protein HptB
MRAQGASWAPSKDQAADNSVKLAFATMTATPHRAPDTMHLDAQALDRLRELDRDGSGLVFGRVMRTFENSLNVTQLALAQAGQRQDMLELRRLAHTLKSSAASVGAVELSAACARLEALARDPEAQHIGELLVQLLDKGAQTQQAVRSLLAPDETEMRKG